MSRLSILTVLVLIFASVVHVQSQNEKSGCPTISVTGPAGIVQPPDLFAYTVYVDPEVSWPKIGFEWTITGGEVVGRTDTKTVKVQPDKYFGKATIASVRVQGLPEGCPNTASEMGGSVCDSYLVMEADVSFWTQYREVTWQGEQKELDSLAIDGLKRNPEHVIYLEKAFQKALPQSAVDSRIRQIRNYLSKVRKLPQSRYFIRVSRGNVNQTNGYLVPQDAPVLVSSYQNPCEQ